MSAVELGAGPAVAAFDVGGTDVKAVLIDESGRVLERVRTPAPAFGPESGAAVMALAADTLDGFLAAHPSLRIAAAGLVVPGVVDDESGIGVESENLGWRDVPFRALLAERTGLPVAFGHDVRAAGLAEQRVGAAAGLRDVAVVTIGTGVAAALFIDGRPYAGRGFAGEIGHARVADGPDCACGGRGCLEAVASAAAITRRYNAATGAGVAGAREVVDRMRAGDRVAQEIYESALDALAFSFSYLVAVVAPEAIVVGGGLSNAGDAFFAQLEQRLRALLTFQPMPELRPARIGADAGAIGAALLARAAAVSS